MTVHAPGGLHLCQRVLLRSATLDMRWNAFAIAKVCTVCLGSSQVVVSGTIIKQSSCLCSLNHAPGSVGKRFELESCESSAGRTGFWLRGKLDITAFL